MPRKKFEKRQRTLVNVADFTAFDEMRQTGYFMLPARKEGERYGKLVVGDVVSKMPLGEDRYQEMVVEADDLADSLINDHGADKFGCFVADGAEPTDEELEKAERVYDEWMRKQVAEADVLWGQYHKHIFIGTHAKTAAKKLGLKREWLADIAETKRCPNCTAPNAPTQARCACGAVLDWERARDMGLLTEREEKRAIMKGLLTDEELVPPEIKGGKEEEEVGTF